MSPFLIAFMISAGAAAWVYSKTMNRTGGNTQNALIVTAVTALMVFVIMLTVLNLIDRALAN